MSFLNNKYYSKAELLKQVGIIDQICGVRISELNDGFERGVRVADFYTASGLRYTVTIDRGLDISSAEFYGISLSFRSPNGDVHPSFYDSSNKEWLRTFKGGLITTCGLTYLGSPCVDEGEELGLHGRISNIPARNISYSGYWLNDDYYIFIEGTVREAVQFGDNILLTRRIESKLGESKILINDVIRNEGYKKSPFMILYHCNIGFPLLDEGCKLITNAKNITPRDEDARKGFSDIYNFTLPIKDFKEQVFYFDMEDTEPIVELQNLNKNLSLIIKYSKKELPNFILWKMLGEGTYVLGLEPANCLVEGRDKERKRGTLQFLEPGEERNIKLEIEVKKLQ